jgi:N-methylhydantoinase A
MVESGPAAGAVAAAYLGQALGRPNVLSFDMGGTTAKTCLIQDGSPQVTKDYQVGGEAGRGSGAFGGASGYPIRTPVIDLAEIGAGGGSIAWVDSGGVLRVGPRSAGAAPGPVCYGQGGEEPTITDANLVLGRINPDYFLGGEIALDVDASHRAVEEKCARPLGMGVEEAAHGVVEIANAAMVNALRLVSVRRGHDPRDFVLVAFGGAGPLHANRIAAESDVPTVLVPTSPGTFSATGLLVTDLKHDYSVTMIQRAEELDPDAVAEAFARMLEMGRSALARESMTPGEMSFERAADVRYYGQSFELTVPLPDRLLAGGTLAEVLQAFHREHEQAYGFAAADEPVEFVNLRVTAIGKIVKPALRRLDRSGGDATEALTGSRQVYFEETGGRTECPIYDRYALSAGAEIPGPAIVEERDSTTVVHPGYGARVDEYGDLLIGRLVGS